MAPEAFDKVTWHFLQRLDIGNIVLPIATGKGELAWLHLPFTSDLHRVGIDFRQQ